MELKGVREQVNVSLFIVDPQNLIYRNTKSCGA